jgi:hypothetical protein
MLTAKQCSEQNIAEQNMAEQNMAEHGDQAVFATDE